MGTAITTLVRKADHAPAKTVGFRHLWGQTKREHLITTAQAEPGQPFTTASSRVCAGPAVRTMAVSDEWSDWPASLTDLFPTSFPGVKTSRDSFLVDIDLDRLRERESSDYFSTPT